MTVVKIQSNRVYSTLSSCKFSFGNFEYGKWRIEKFSNFTQ